MRALVAYRKTKARSKKWKTVKSPYMRFQDDNQIQALKRKLRRMGYEVKVFTHLGW